MSSVFPALISVHRIEGFYCMYDMAPPSTWVLVPKQWYVDHE